MRELHYHIECDDPDCAEGVEFAIPHNSAGIYDTHGLIEFMRKKRQELEKEGWTLSPPNKALCPDHRPSNEDGICV